MTDPADSLPADSDPYDPLADPSPARAIRHPAFSVALVTMIIAAALLVTLRLVAFEVFYIPSGSMEDTLHVGDRVMVNRLAYRLGDVERGDVIVFDGAQSWDLAVNGASTDPSQDYIKRVIGLPGDRVRCCDREGRILVNGTPIDEPYVYPGDDASEDAFDILVPEGRVWVMGDHRSASADSRAHIGDPGGGAVPIDSIVGEAFVVVWPLSDMRRLASPQTGVPEPDDE